MATLLQVGWLTLAAVVPEFTEEGWRVPQPGATLDFPRAHGSHPDSKIEWWYLTGHLFDERGARYGFQATFFRSGLQPPAQQRGMADFGGDHLFLAHMALSDPGEEIFYHEERLNRDGWDASAATQDLDVRNGNWSLRRVENPAERLLLQSSIRAQVQLSLELTPRKPLVRFGEEGLSRKGSAPAAVSTYLSWTRLEVAGDLVLASQKRRVTGEAWMDHEIASQQLSEHLEGWDWVAIQLVDGREIKAYLLRQEGGGNDPFSRAIWIDETGRTTAFAPPQFRWEYLRWWESSDTGARYPVSFDLTLPDPRSGAQRTLRIEPLMEAQELTGTLGGIAYWEGACDVTEDGQIVGRAYLELAGYDGNLTSALR